MSAFSKKGMPGIPDAFSVESWHNIEIGSWNLMLGKREKVTSVGKGKYRFRFIEM